MKRLEKIVEISLDEALNLLKKSKEKLGVQGKEEYFLVARGELGDLITRIEDNGKVLLFEDRAKEMRFIK